MNNLFSNNNNNTTTVSSGKKLNKDDIIKIMNMTKIKNMKRAHTKFLQHPNTHCGSAIITCVKHEHDFINYWIEYHHKLGFSHFYILVDNILKKQKEYFIDDKFVNFVTLVEATENDVFHYLKYSTTDILKVKPYYYIMHELLNQMIIHKNIIKQKWVTAIGVDQFIYLNGYTVSEYLKIIETYCTQIIFPWSFCFFNSNDSKFDDPLKNLNLYYNIYKGVGDSGPGISNSMIRTKNLLALNSDSHTFISKTPRQIIHIINEYYYGVPSTLITPNIFKIVSEKMDAMPFYNLKISSFHIVLRNMNEYFIKNIFGYNEHDNTSEYLCLLAKCIKDYSIDVLYATNLKKNRLPHLLSLKDNLFVNWSINLKIPVIENKSKCDYYENLISSGLNIHGITIEQYNNWKKHVLGI